MEDGNPGLWLKATFKVLLGINSKSPLEFWEQPTKKLVQAKKRNWYPQVQPMQRQIHPMQWIVQIYSSTQEITTKTSVAEKIVLESALTSNIVAPLAANVITNRNMVEELPSNISGGTFHGCSFYFGYKD